MTQKQLAKEIATETTFSIKEVNNILNMAFDKIKEEVKNGGKLIVHDFGTFSLKHRNERKARNIQTGEEVIIPAKEVPSFKASSTFLR